MVYCMDSKLIAISWIHIKLLHVYQSSLGMRTSIVWIRLASSHLTADNFVHEQSLPPQLMRHILRNG